MTEKRYMVSFSCGDGIFEFEIYAFNEGAAIFLATIKLLASVKDESSFYFKNCAETPEEGDED